MTIEKNDDCIKRSWLLQEIEHDLGCYDIRKASASTMFIKLGEVVKMIDLNVKALVLLTHMTVPYMEIGGRIIQLGSGSCFTPLPYFNIYSSSKVFVLHYTKSLNYELKKYGIRATCFCPGWVETEFLGKSVANGNTHPKAMKPLLKCEDVVRRCIKASIKGRAMCVTNWYTKLQHLLFKLVPDCILTKLWIGMLEGERKTRSFKVE